MKILVILFISFSLLSCGNNVLKTMYQAHRDTYNTDELRSRSLQSKLEFRNKLRKKVFSDQNLEKIRSYTLIEKNSMEGVIGCFKSQDRVVQFWYDYFDKTIEYDEECEFNEDLFDFFKQNNQQKLEGLSKKFPVFHMGTFVVFEVEKGRVSMKRLLGFNTIYVLDSIHGRPYKDEDIFK